MAGLLDFSQGAMAGASSTAATGNPWIIGGSALGGGILNYFAGKEEDRLNRPIRELNMQLGKQNLQSGRQGLQLGRLQISREKMKAREEAIKKQKLETFRRLFSESFL